MLAPQNFANRKQLMQRVDAMLAPPSTVAGLLSVVQLDVQRLHQINDTFGRGFGDAVGVAHGVNTATIRAYTDGILTTTNVIVPGPWFLEAAKMLRENPGLVNGQFVPLYFASWDELRAAATAWQRGAAAA